MNRLVECDTGASDISADLKTEVGLHCAVTKFLERATHLRAIPQVLFPRRRFGQLLSEEEDKIVEAFG